MRYTMFLIPCCLVAQQTVAPTPDPSSRGVNTGGYNVVNWFETGYRYSLIDGNLGKYRSDVNYRNGLRLLSSSLSVNSREGQGGLFDQLLLNTIGLGNDPYQSATLRLEKNGFYRYNLNWRLDEFFNPGLTVSTGLHLMDTRRRLQDHDLTLLPQSNLKFHLGYTRNTQTGPALTSELLFDARGTFYPAFADVRRARNEYRLGVEGVYAGFVFHVMHRWDYFKEDTPYTPIGEALITRAEPYHGASPAWFGNVHTTRKVWAANARFTYVGGRRDFVVDETASLPTRTRQIVVAGSARRPVTAGDFSFSIFPGQRLTVVNNTSFHSTRIDGDSSFLLLNNSSQTFTGVDFQFLGVRTTTNSTDATYRASDWLTLYGGYRFSNRAIRSVQFGMANRQENDLHSGTAGVRLRPLKPLTVSLDGEIGRADGPFTPVSERNYHGMRARIDYRTRRLQIGANYRQNYNNNSVTLSAHSARARNFGANLSWAARSWLWVDASYAKLHLDTISGLAFFAAIPRPTLIQGVDSIYISNIHSGNLGLRATMKRAEIYAGYTITRDNADPQPPPFAGGISDVVQTYPLSYQTPLARLSLRITNKLRWNAGWQFYRYREDTRLFSVYQDYRAHTGYTSVSWSF